MPVWRFNQFIDECLLNYLKVKDISTVIAVQEEDRRNEDDKSRKLHVICPTKDPLRPKYFFIRIAPKTNRKSRAYKMLYARENFVRTEVIPGMSALYEEKHVPLMKRFLSYSKDIGISLKLGRECVILEDDEHILKLVRYDKSVPMDPEVVRLVLQTLGRFHAFSYGLKKHKSSEMFHNKSNLQDIFVDTSRKQSDFQKLLEICDDLCLHPVFQEDPMAEDRLRALKMYFDKSMLRGMPFARPTVEEVIIQGISRTSDIFIKYMDPLARAAPTAVIFTDWQYCRMGSQTVDLMSFLYSFLDDSSVKKFYLYLTYYYEEFVECGKYFNLDLRVEYSYTHFKGELTKCIKYVAAVVILSSYKTHIAPRIAATPEEERDAFMRSPEYNMLFDTFAKRVHLIIKHMTTIRLI